jgi:LPXTG-motif cell wall-anchored protein
MPEFMQQTWFMVVMAVALLALIGVLLVFRNRRSEDE